MVNFQPAFVAYILVSCSYRMNIECIITPKHFLICYLYSAITVVITRLSGHFVWTIILGYRNPMPFNGQLIGLVCLFLFQLILWFRFPYHWRQNEHFRKRFKFYIHSFLGAYFTAYAIYAIYMHIYALMPQKYQWIPALTLPLARQFNLWIQSKPAYKAAGGVNDSSVELSFSQNITIQHCAFLTVMLGTSATDVTCWITLGMDFTINIYKCLKIIWLKQTRLIDEKKEKEMVQSLLALVINEVVEAVVPLTYLICFMMAYYGPNAELIGNIRNGYWQYTPVSNIERFIKNVLLYFFVDFTSAIISAILLWTFCRINIIRAYMHWQKEFWLVMAVNTAYFVNMVSYKMLIYFTIKIIL